MEPCPACLELAKEKALRIEAVQRLPIGAAAPLSRFARRKVCQDCASAEAMTGTMGMTFEMARIAVANDRQEQYRLPGAPMGLVKSGRVRPSKPGDLEDQLRWLDSMNWFGLKEQSEP